MVTIKRTSGTYLTPQPPLQNSEGNTEECMTTHWHSALIYTHAKPQKILNY